MFHCKQFIICLFVCSLAELGFGEDHAIVPGERLGSFVLGDTLQQMHQLHGKPDTSVRLSGGVIREDWLEKKFAPKAYVQEGLYFKHEFVTVYFMNDHAIQIEASSPLWKTKDGLTAKSGADQFQKRHMVYTQSDLHHFRNADPGGCPATKHFVTYGDAVKAGIAWRYGAWGNLAPDPDPQRLELIAVHLPGKPVLIDPDGGIRLVWKIPPHKLREHYPTK